MMMNDDGNNKNDGNGPGDEIEMGDDFGESLGDDLDDASDDLTDDFGDDFGEDPGFIDDFSDEENRGTFGYMWRNNPLVKAGVVLGVAAVLLAIVIWLGLEPDRPAPSVMSTGSDITQVPGQEQVSKRIEEAYQDLDKEAEIKARQEGESFVPVPLDPTVDQLSIPEEEEPQEDPLQRWRRLQEEKLQKELERTEIVEPSPPPSGPDPAIGALAEAMSQQMQSILERHGQNNFGYKLISDQQYIDSIYSGAGGSGDDGDGDGDGGGDGDDGDDIEEGKVLITAGEIFYGQLITEANSDIPGPVVALISSGPLKGSRMVGGFDVQNELISLLFDTVVYKGRSLNVDAVALNPNTTLPGLATEVDHRYLKRIVLPAASAFIEGAASAISNSGLTTVTIEGETVAEETNDSNTDQEIASGIEEAAQEVSEIIDEMVDGAQVLVRIEPGTPIGILFLNEVIDEGASN